jgi:aminoglycoside phosphotransferase (APT) family kinase protein
MTELGEKIGESAWAEVFAIGTGRVLKLYREGTPPGIIDHEVSQTSAAFLSGAPAPEVFGTKQIDGRTGIIFTRYNGRTLEALVLTGAMSPSDAGATLARVHADLHAGQYRAGVWSLRSFLDAIATRLARRGVPADVVERSRDIARELPECDTLCHGDLHFGNVLITPDGPRIIDWISAMSASPLADVARQHLTLSVFHAPPEYDRARREAEQSFMQTYAALTATTEPALREAIQPYTTVLAATRITEGGCTANERETLIDLVRSRLH